MSFINKQFKITASLVAMTSLLFWAVSSQASHHFESRLAIQNPNYDLTDLYVFESDRSGNTAFILDVNPTTGKEGKASFGKNGVYSFHIANDRQLKKGGLTITVHHVGNELIFGIANGANQAVGTIGDQVGTATVGKEKVFKNGMRVWSGAARDPFVGNSAGIIAFNQELAQGKLDLAAFKDGVDLFETLNSSIIVVEVPNTMLPKKMFVYASSAMYNVDKWEQVNRMANPLITHLFMSTNKMEVAEHVGHRPDIDSREGYAISGTVLRAVSLDKKLSDPVAYADSVAAKMLPDLIPYEAGTKALYSFESINGRKPSDDAMDAALSIFLGRKVTDNANIFDRHPSKFPYVVPIN